MFVDMLVQCQNLPTLYFFLTIMRGLEICLAEVCKFMASTRRRIKKSREVTAWGKVLNSNVRFLSRGRKLSPKTKAQNENWASSTYISLLILPSHQFVLSSSEKDGRNLYIYNKSSLYLQGTESSQELLRPHYCLVPGSTVGYPRLWTMNILPCFLGHKRRMNIKKGS